MKEISEESLQLYRGCEIPLSYKHSRIVVFLLPKLLTQYIYCDGKEDSQNISRTSCEVLKSSLQSI